MNRFIPYEKLSKKKKKEHDRRARGSWNGVNPVTRRVESKKKYNRKRVSQSKEYFRDALLIYDKKNRKYYFFRNWSNSCSLNSKSLRVLAAIVSKINPEESDNRPLKPINPAINSVGNLSTIPV